MPTTDANHKFKRPKIDTVTPTGFLSTPAGPQQFVITGIRLQVCSSNEEDERSLPDAALRGPPLAPVKHVKADEPMVPKDYAAVLCTRAQSKATTNVRLWV